MASHGSYRSNIFPHCFLHMAESVAAEVLAVEPPSDHDDAVPHSLSFEHPKYDHAGLRPCRNRS